MDEKFSHELLVRLRALFREDFQRHDYCIGQECVERMFRELLNEPIPDSIPIQSMTYPQASKVLNDLLPEFQKKLTHVIKVDNNFFTRFK